MRDLINNFRFWLAKKIGGPTLKKLGPTVSAEVTLFTPTLRPTAISVPEDAPYSHDKLNREEFGTGLCNLLSFGDNTVAIFLDGAWGTGKSTFLKMLVQQLRNHVEGSERMIVIEMNAWENDAFREPIEYISEKIREGLKKHKKILLPKLWQRWFLIPLIVDFILKVSKIPYLSSMISTGHMELLVCLQALQAMVDILKRFERPTNYHGRILENLKIKLEKEATKLWDRRNQGGSSRIVVIIDELDRCRPDYAIRFLETIKHVFEVAHVTFLLAIDKNQLTHSLRGVYGGDFDAEKYLERFGDVWLKLPESSKTDFIRGVLENIGFENYLPKGTNDDHTLDGITANDMMIAVLVRAKKNLREIEKIVSEIRAMVWLSREQIKDCSIGVIALALARHVAPDSYEELNNPETTQESTHLLAKAIGRSVNDKDPALILVFDMLHCLQAEALNKQPGSSSLLKTFEEEPRRKHRKHLANYNSARRAIDLYGSVMQAGDENEN